MLLNLCSSGCCSWKRIDLSPSCWRNIYLFSNIGSLSKCNIMPGATPVSQGYFISSFLTSWILAVIRKISLQHIILIILWTQLWWILTLLTIPVCQPKLSHSMYLPSGVPCSAESCSSDIWGVAQGNKRCPGGLGGRVLENLVKNISLQCLFCLHLMINVPSAVL